MAQRAIVPQPYSTRSIILVIIGLIVLGSVSVALTPIRCPFTEALGPPYISPRDECYTYYATLTGNEKICLSLGSGQPQINLGSRFYLIKECIIRVAAEKSDAKKCDILQKRFKDKTSEDSCRREAQHLPLTNTSPTPKEIPSYRQGI